MKSNQEETLGAEEATVSLEEYEEMRMRMVEFESMVSKEKKESERVDPKSSHKLIPLNRLSLEILATHEFK